MRSCVTTVLNRGQLLILKSYILDSASSMNEADFSDEEFYSGASSDGSLVESRERAEAIVQARVNGHAPPLPPRKSPVKVRYF